MRRLLVSDNADTRHFLFAFIRELSKTTRKLDLPEHAITVLYRLVAQPGARAAYKDVLEACELTAGQMASAVRGLVGARLVVRGHDPSDHRRLELRLTKKGLNAYDETLKATAQSIE